VGNAVRTVWTRLGASGVWTVLDSVNVELTIYGLSLYIVYLLVILEILSPLASHFRGEAWFLRRWPGLCGNGF